MPKSKKTRKRIDTTLDEKLLAAAKHLAVDQNRNLNDIIEEALELYLKKQKRSGKK